MTTNSHKPASAALIVGCGYLGRRVADRLLARGITVFGTTRSEQRARELAGLGIRPLILHVTQPLTYASLRPALEADSLDLAYMVPPGRMNAHPTARQTILGGIGHTLKALKQASLRRAVLISSTAVYGQQNGERVDADTPPAPAGERGRLLHQGETLWLEAGPPMHVLRLAGLYGPGRIVGFRAVTDGSPLIGDPHAMLNLLHVDDAADLVVAMLAAAQPGRVELGSDGHPVARLSYYNWLANRLGVPPPPVLSHEEAAQRLGVDAQRLARSASKALDNIATCQRTGWAPRYANYKLGVEALLENLPHKRSPKETT